MKDTSVRSIFFLLTIALLLFSACSKGIGQVNVKAADFTLEGLDAEKIVLLDILKERKAVLVFWATWCYYCNRAIPQIEKFYKENKEEVAVIAIDIGESRAKVKKFVQRMQISYPVALDTNGSIAKLYNIMGVPTIVTVDKDGKILYFGHSLEEMQVKLGF